LPDVEAYNRLKAELAAENDVIGPVSRRARTKAQYSASSKFSETVYGKPDGARRLADRVLQGKFGKHMSRVYFIGRGEDGPIKIGIAHDPEKRRIDLQVAVPEELYILAAFRGDIAVERMLHAIFEPDHIRGEWFRRSPALVEFIGHLTKPALYPNG
jgi:hypothetical protein